MTKSFTLQMRVLLLGANLLTYIVSGLTLEDDRFQQLQANYVLTAKVLQLEVKVTRLEEKVLEQDSLIIAMKRKERFSFGSEWDTNNVDPAEFAIRSNKMTILRTCREARASDPSLTSGMYWIDPDGQGVGDDPIYVYCDMMSGSTSILHDSEGQLDVGHCAEPGCYSRTIRYNATSRQIAALAELSKECHQSIRYDCISAPFEVYGVTYSWWNDKNGNAQYFWSGRNTSIHICQCGIDGNCVEPFMPCNCDSSLPTLFADYGVITDKNILPITRLNFGRTILGSSSGVHTLGRLECIGQAAIGGMPKSCADLWRIGHTLNGLYSVLGNQQIETVYCDFTMLPDEQNFQTWIGYNDVKSSPTYFYVQKSVNFTLKNTPIPFEVERLNVGNAMNASTGIFTAPRSGRYSFSLSGIAELAAAGDVRPALILNGNAIGISYSNDAAPSRTKPTYSLHSTLNMRKGDQIWLEILVIGGNGIGVYDDGSHYTHFIGWLLEEDVSQSINAVN